MVFSAWIAHAPSCPLEGAWGSTADYGFDRLFQTAAAIIYDVRDIGEFGANEADTKATIMLTLIDSDIVYTEDCLRPIILDVVESIAVLVGDIEVNWMRQ